MEDRVLLRAAEVPGTPVVTVGGDDIAQVRDVLFDSTSGEVVGFTLAKRGLFGGPMKQRLPWANVVGLGPHAVIVADADAFVARGEFGAPADDRDMLGARVITDDGRRLGTVSDLVLEVHDGKADVVGYELSPSEGFRETSQHVLLPLPDTLAASGDNLVVPASATEYVRDDVAGFGAAVEDFRRSLTDAPHPDRPATEGDAP